MDETIDYICDKCGCGRCILTVEKDSSVPDWCPYTDNESTNWRLKGVN